MTVPSTDQIADRAYAAMCRLPRSRELFDAAVTDRSLLATYGPDERALAVAYAQRRRDLTVVYGIQAPALQAREDRLNWLRLETPQLSVQKKIAWVKRYYGRDADTLGDFIHDWGYTYDPRLISEGRNPTIAFDLWPKQRELIRFIVRECWEASKPGVIVKARDVGASWVCMALLDALCIFRQGFAAGVGSATEVKVDRSGDSDTLFYKVRSFLEHLPVEFNGGYDQDRTSAYMRITFPLTGSSITGEAGDKMGRGGRKSIYVVDESAHLERPKLIDRNLSANTNCRIDISSVNGPANSFYTRAHNAAIPRFDFSWRDDPRKNYPGSTWEEQTRATSDEVSFKQEYLCDFMATLEGSIIPVEWAQAAVDIDQFLGIDMTSGALRGALDIADRGNDLCAFALARGRKIIGLWEWSGKGSDTGYSVQRAMGICSEHGLQSFDYDADGMGGAAVHSDARLINEARGETQRGMMTTARPKEYFAAGVIGTHPYRGSEAVVNPESIVPGTKRKAGDFFGNRKSQTWYMGRLGCWNAWKARKGQPYDAHMVLCIQGGQSWTNKLVVQLAQAQAKETLTGKLMVDKNPDEVSSPDGADAVLMATCQRRRSMSMGSLLTAVGGTL